MSRVADAEQARPVPLPEAIELDGEQLDLAPILQLIHPPAQVRCELYVLPPNSSSPRCRISSNEPLRTIIPAWK